MYDESIVSQRKNLTAIALFLSLSLSRPILSVSAAKSHDLAMSSVCPSFELRNDQAKSTLGGLATALQTSRTVSWRRTLTLRLPVPFVTQTGASTNCVDVMVNEGAFGSYIYSHGYAYVIFTCAQELMRKEWEERKGRKKEFRVQESVLKTSLVGLVGRPLLNNERFRSETSLEPASGSRDSSLAARAFCRPLAQASIGNGLVTTKERPKAYQEQLSVEVLLALDHKYTRHIAVQKSQAYNIYKKNISFCLILKFKFQTTPTYRVIIFLFITWSATINWNSVLCLFGKSLKVWLLQTVYLSHFVHWLHRVKSTLLWTIHSLRCSKHRPFKAGLAIYFDVKVIYYCTCKKESWIERVYVDGIWILYTFSASTHTFSQTLLWDACWQLWFWGIGQQTCLCFSLLPPDFSIFYI